MLWNIMYLQAQKLYQTWIRIKLKPMILVKVRMRGSGGTFKLCCIKKVECVKSKVNIDQ